MNTRSGGYWLVGLALASAFIWFVLGGRSPREASVVGASESDAVISAGHSPYAAGAASTRAVKVESATRGKQLQSPESKNWAMVRRLYPIAADGTTQVPERYRLPGVARVVTGRNFEDWMARFPATDRELLRAFDQRHFGIYHVDNPETVAWMATQGYPMPEDLIAAQAMSTQQLRELAHEGNVKAAFLLRERIDDELESAIHAGLDRVRFMQDNPRYDEDDGWLRTAMRSTNSAYKGYLLARSASLASDDADWIDAQVMAGLEIATALGDARGARLAQVYAHADPSRVQIRSRMLLAQQAYSLYVSTEIVLRYRAAGCALEGVVSDYNPTWLPSTH